jgi:hypothetical protein
LTFGKTETVADKGSCFGWAKYQGRNFCTAESILGFSRPVKYGLKRCPKSPKNGSSPASQSRETPIYKQIVSPAGSKKGVQNGGEKWHQLHVTLHLPASASTSFCIYQLLHLPASASTSFCIYQLLHLPAELIHWKRAVRVT